MVFPIKGINGGGSRGSNATSTSVANPGGLTTGRDVYVFFACDTDLTVTTGTSGWSSLFVANGDNEDSLTVFKGVVGTAVWPLVLSHNSENTAWIIQEIGNGGVPLFSTTAVSNSGSPNPPSFTPPGGAQDFLWITCYVNETGGTRASAPPSGFSGMLTRSAGSSATGTQLGISFQELNAATLDPGDWTGAPSDNWGAFTMVIPGVAVTSDTLKILIGDLTLSGDKLYAGDTKINKVYAGDVLVYEDI